MPTHQFPASSLDPKAAEIAEIPPPESEAGEFETAPAPGKLIDRRASARARRAAGVISRRHAGRLTNESLLTRAEFLPPIPRALVSARYALGMRVDELAMIHHLTIRQMRRRLDRICRILADPCFVMAAQFSDRLPAELAALARDYWIENQTLRQLAAARQKTLHRIRRDIDITRSLLVVALAGEQKIPPELARAAITGHAIRKTG